MDYTIHPLKGVNQIEFGVQAARVRQDMGTKYISGDFRAVSKEHPTDFFKDAGMFAYYDADGHLEAMEFASPGRVFLGGVNLLSMHFSQVMALLTKLDSHYSEDRAGACFRTLSIGIYAPRSIDEEDAPVEAVLVGRPGYYGAPGA